MINRQQEAYISARSSLADLMQIVIFVEIYKKTINQLNTFTKGNDLLWNIQRCS